MEPRPKKLMKMEAEPRQHLPDDLVLEIVARCPTIAGVIRCAAASKPIRRGILNAPFLRRLLRSLFHNNGGGEHGHGGPPLRKLLLGMYHKNNDPRRPPAFVPASDDGSADLLPPSVAALPPAPPSCDVAAGDDDDGGACDFGAYLPVASRRSLLVLRRRCRNGSRDHLVARHGPHPVELSVCNPATGERRVLPPHDVLDASLALLEWDAIALSPQPPPLSFRLLAAELSINDPSTLHAQVFSSDSGEWAPPMACPITRRPGGREVPCEFAGGRPRPVVVGGSVHWLCTTALGDGVLTWRWREEGGGVAHEASVVKLPRGYRFERPQDMCLAVLSPPAAGSEAVLGLIFRGLGEILVWARMKRGEEWKWKLWRRIHEASIPRPANLWYRWFRGGELSCYCEGSGTLVMRAGDWAMSPLLLDMESMKVSKIDARKWELRKETEFCPYEVDLLSYMLFVMKRF
ncbi:unnamed protein product [Urochloa decumbens]|uniref:DUF7595 domain-containing protein n=1 Tax=Urochloa decumbens TaxID=240449 RepID=A0ABC8YY66_9POAL